MKRIFSFLLLLLFVLLSECTILSGFIEKAMTVQVVTVTGKYDEASSGCRVPIEVLRSDEETPAFLYAIETGAGLTYGLWAKKMPVVVTGYQENAAITNALSDEEYVRFASRPLQDGEPLAVLEESSRAPDTYLVCAPKALSLSGTSAETPKGFCWLLPQESAAQPFLADRAKAGVFEDGAEAYEGISLYSFREIEAFFSALPLLAAAGILTLAPLVLCFPFFWSGALTRKRPRFLFAGSLVVCWSGLTLLLGQIRLPSSLLPVHMIFDFGHYKTLFDGIKTALIALSGDPAASALLAHLHSKTVLAVAVCILGVLLLLGGLILYAVLRTRWAKARTSCRY